jgi:Flp pilus assembly protein CpaB
LKAKNVAILVIQLGVVVGFTAAFYHYDKQEVNPTTVYAFKQNLQAGSQIIPADIVPTTIPQKAVTPAFALNPTDILGMYLSSNVYAGTYVYGSELTKTINQSQQNLNYTRLRMLTIPVTYNTAINGTIQHGDKVDLIYTGTGTKTTSNGPLGGQLSTPFTYSQTFMENVLVWSINDSQGNPYKSTSTIMNPTGASASSSTGMTASGGPLPSAPGSSNSNSNSSLATVSLAVTLNQAEQILTREKAGGTITLVARFPQSKSYYSDGYVIGANGYAPQYTGPAKVESSMPTIIPNQEYYN